jgi:hypothetical protein
VLSDRTSPRIPHMSLYGPQRHTWTTTARLVTRVAAIGSRKSKCIAVLHREHPTSRGPDGVPPLSVRPVSRVEIHRSRQLISDSRALMASAKTLIAQSRQAMARQSYVRIVCAWCQETIRFERSAVTVRGQVSHSICFACFAHVFPELDQRPPLPLCSPQLP